jgi:hypothetical protein
MTLSIGARRSPGIGLDKTAVASEALMHYIDTGSPSGGGRNYGEKEARNALQF